MSWFSGLGESLGSSGVLGPLVLGASVLGAAYLTTKSNSDAADRVADANAQAAQMAQQAATSSNARSDQLLQAGAPGVSRLRSIMAENPNRLSKDQQDRVDDMRGQQAQFLAVSGLKGAGQAAVDAVRAREDATVTEFQRQNRARQDNAATQLTNVAVGATNAMNATDKTAAASMGALGQNTAVNQGQAGISNADQTGAAMGAIASLIAADNKRNSRYGDNSKEQV